MADNIQMNSGSGGVIAVGVELTFSGDTATLQGTFPAIVTGSEGAWSMSPIVGGAGAVSAGTQRMTLASDDPAVALLGTIDTDTGTIATNTSTIAGAISGTEMQVDVLTMPTVTVSATNFDIRDLTSASDSVAAVCTNAGTFAVQAAQSGTWTVQPGNTANTTAWLVTGTGGTFPVSGVAAHGAAVSGNPVLLAGENPLGNVARLQTATDGDLIVHQHSDTVSLADDISNTPQVTINEDDAGILYTPTVGFMFDGTGWDRIRGTSADGLLVNLGSNNDVTITSGTVTTVTTLANGQTAHDSAVTGSPLRVGAKAETALSGITLVADGDATDLHAGVDGVLITRPHCNLEDIVSGVAAITDGSSTSVIAAAGSGVKIYITSVIIANSSATAVSVDIRDGAAGTVKATFPAPPDMGGVVHALPVPIPFSANTAVCADPSASASTISVTLVGFKSKV